MAVTEVKAAAYSLIVEMLNEQEVAGSSLVLSVREKESNQAIVRSVGPLVPKDCGVQVGDLVLLQSTFTPVPKPMGSTRKWGSIELHAIKAVLVSDQPIN